MQWLARLPGTQEIRGSSPGRGMTDFCTSIYAVVLIVFLSISVIFLTDIYNSILSRPKEPTFNQ